MKSDILKKLIYIRITLLLTKSFKRQKYIDESRLYVENKLSEFHEETVDTIKSQISGLPRKDVDKLFCKYFWYYRIIKFGNLRLAVDSYLPRDCRTFSQYNKILRLALVAIDYRKNLDKK